MYSVVLALANIIIINHTHKTRSFPVRSAH